MPPKKYKPVDTGRTEEEAKTRKTDHSERPAYHFGEQGTSNCSVPYAGVRRSINCTVNPAELQRGIAKQKAAFAKVIAEHAEYRRVPKGERQLKHKLPLEEEYLPDGDVKVTRPSTETTRREH